TLSYLILPSNPLFMQQRLAEVKKHSDNLEIFNNDHSKFINRDGNNVRLSDINNKSITIQGSYSNSFSHGINRIVSYFIDNNQQTIKLFDLQNNPIGELIKMNSNESAYISKDYIVIEDSQVKGIRIFNFSAKLNAAIQGVNATFNKDGSRIATRLGNKILLWDAQGNRIGTEIETGWGEGNLWKMYFSPDSSKLIVIAEKKLQIWDLESRQQVTKDIKRGFSNGYSNIVITVDGNGMIKCWNLKGSLIKEINVKQTDDDSVSFSRDGKYFLTTSGENSNKKVQIWNMQGNLVGSPKQDFGDISRTAFSFDGQKLITYAKDNTVRIWDITGNLTAELKGHIEAVNSVKLSADSSKIVTASRDKTLRVWDATGNLIGIISAPNASTFSSADFSADGSKIITFASDGKARVYDNNFATNDEQLWQLGCKKLADYLTYNPKATEEDKKMCGIAIDKK
ncbi:MAG: hypothetical protein WCO45_19350, partial [Pseudanabaena sp. ELA607]